MYKQQQKASSAVSKVSPSAARTLSPSPASVPIPFKDIGKSIGDLLGKDYPLNGIKMENKTTATNGVAFIVNGLRDNKSGSINGEMKTKWTDKKNGITFTESWSSKNVISSIVELQNTITPGLKMELNGSFNPTNGEKNTKITAEYKKNILFAHANIDLFKGPIITSNVVLNQKGVLLGAEASYNINESKFTRYNVALGYNTPEYCFALHALDGFNTYSASYFHKVNKDVEAGTKATWNKNSTGPVNIEFGSKYNINKDAFIKAKVDMNGRVGLGYTQTIQKGIKLSLGGSFDTQRLNENAHKVGMNITFDQ